MKTVFSYCGRWSCRMGFLSLLLLFFGLSANAQRGGYKGVTNRNGMLVFTDSLAFQSVYQQLEAEIEAQDRNPNAKPGPMLPGNCEDDNAVLANFETLMGIQSMRRKYLVKECQDLARGLSPEQLSENPIPDDILAAFLNEKGEMQVGGVIYYIPSVETYFLISNGNTKTLRALQQGANPGMLSDVEVHNNLEFDVDFQVDYPDENQVRFTYTGDRVRGMTFYWNFGDGTTSTAMNPVHVFRSKAEDFDVRLTVSIPSNTGGGTRDGEGGVNWIMIAKKISKYIDCRPWLTYNETGVPGQMCFQAHVFGNHEIVNVQWDFGDGNSSDQLNPCNTYLCDKKYHVSLTIDTEDSCHYTTTFPVWINSYNCCNASSVTVSGNHYFQGDTRYVFYKQRQYYIGVYTYIGTKMKHYELKSNGKWKNTKTSQMKLIREGSVFGKGAAGCKCENPISVADTKVVYNKRKITMNKTIWFKEAKIDKDNPWLVKYYVDYNHLLTKSTDISCD